MALEQYQSRIEEHERVDSLPTEVDEYGQLYYETAAEYSAECLCEIAIELRQTCWSAPFRDWARELADRAAASADRIIRAAGGIGGG
jgi:hypothetical protein